MSGVNAERSSRSEVGALAIALIFVAAGVTAGTLLTLVYLAMLLVLSRKWGFEPFWEALYAARDLVRGRRDAEDEE